MKSEATSIRSFQGIFLGINILIGIIGLTCFAVGIYIRYNADDAKATMAVAYLLIFGGFFSMLISLLGCLGALLQSNCILFLYFFITVAMFILLIAIGIYSFKQVHLASADEMKFMEAVKSYSTNESSQAIVDKYHKERNCCGIKDPIQDFNGTIPSSCQAPLVPNQTTTPSNKDSEGASSSTEYRSCIHHGSMRDYMATAGGLALGFAIIVLLSIVGVVFLCGAIRNQTNQ